MEIKIIFACIAFFAVSFLTRFLVALLREAALDIRRQSPQPVVIRESNRMRAQKLSRMRIADQNEIRLISMP
jgi:hypothetical protein